MASTKRKARREQQRQLKRLPFVKKDFEHVFAAIAAAVTPSPLRRLWEARAVAHDAWLEAGGCMECAGTLRVVVGRERGSVCHGEHSAGVDPLYVRGDVKLVRAPPMSTGIGSLDAILGGGIVPGSSILLNGHTGIGKSTLCLQIAEGVRRVTGRQARYVSEHSASDVTVVTMNRLGVNADIIFDRNVDLIIAGAGAYPRVPLLIVDSVNTVSVENVGRGERSQLSAAVLRLSSFARESGTAVIMVNRATRDGGVRGGSLLFHAVDTVVYLNEWDQSAEGAPISNSRVVRVDKNRWGPSHTHCTLVMTNAGLRDSGDGFRWNEHNSVNIFEMRRQIRAQRIAQLEQELAELRAEESE